MLDTMQSQGPISPDLSLLGIIGGTGIFGRSLAKRLLIAGYHVMIGSRRPHDKNLAARDKIFEDVRICGIEECIRAAPTLILCLHKKHFNHALLSYQHLLTRKVIIDVSNQEIRDRNESNAEYLATMFQEACICKAFNTISAYNMENTGYCQESTHAFVACNNSDVRHAVIEMARYMGFKPVDMGRLYQAKQLEKATIRILSGWGSSIMFGLCIYFVWLFYCIMIYYIKTDSPRSDQNFIKVMNKPCGMVCMTLLSLAYLAGCFASFTQLHKGTKHLTFDRYLDKWLKARKSLTVMAMLFGFMHMVLSIAVMGPRYYPAWYKTVHLEVEEGKHESWLWMTWQGEAIVSSGVIAFLFLAITSVAFIPSISNSLNWREFRFFRSGMGHTAMLISIVHVLIVGISLWKEGSGPLDVIQSISFQSIILPLATIILRLVLILPCVSSHLNDIHQGIDRDKDAENGESTAVVVSEKEKEVVEKKRHRRKRNPGDNKPRKPRVERTKNEELAEAV